MERSEIGQLGERLAAGVLRRHGVRILERNVEFDGGEVDIVGVDGDVRIVVEVRTLTGEEDPLKAFGPTKQAKVRRLAGKLGARRVDLVAIRLGEEAAEVRWVKGAA